MDITTLNFKKFSDRINYLANLFGSKELAFVLSQNEEDVEMWSNSATLVESPVRIDYTYLTHKYPQFRSEWLQNGEGEIFNSGSEEENVKKIKARVSMNKVNDSISKMEQEHLRMILNEKLDNKPLIQ